jgi:hypothetical protein
MANEEATLKEFSAARAELKDEVLDLIVKFEKRFPGAEVVDFRIERVDTRCANSEEGGSVISGVEVSIMVT